MPTPVERGGTTGFFKGDGQNLPRQHRVYKQFNFEVLSLIPCSSGVFLSSQFPHK